MKLHADMSILFFDNTLYPAFFRSKNLIETAWHGTTEVTRDVVKHLVEERVINETDPLAYACDLAYERLLLSSRPEYVYKNVLLSKMVFGTHSPATTSWLYEFRVGEADRKSVV